MSPTQFSFAVAILTLAPAGFVGLLLGWMERARGALAVYAALALAAVEMGGRILLDLKLPVEGADFSRELFGEMLVTLGLFAAVVACVAALISALRAHDWGWLPLVGVAILLVAYATVVPIVPPGPQAEGEWLFGFFSLAHTDLSLLIAHVLCAVAATILALAYGLAAVVAGRGTGRGRGARGIADAGG